MVVPKIDVRDLESVRAAARDTGGVVLGDDFVVPPPPTSDSTTIIGRRRRGLQQLRRSPLARKITTFNLLALTILVTGLLYLNPARDNLAYQRASAMVNEVELIADVFEAQLPILVAVVMRA